jgi:hypothetical protein
MGVKSIQSVGRKTRRIRFTRETRCKWEDSIDMDLKEIGYEGVGWIHLAQDREQWQSVVNRVMNLQVTQNAENFLNG